jgi:hypothetical protein
MARNPFGITVLAARLGGISTSSLRRKLDRLETAGLFVPKRFGPSRVFCDTDVPEIRQALAKLHDAPTPAAAAAAAG